MNRVILMGRLTHDPELRHAPSGTVWTSFSIAVDRRGAKEGQQKADFIPCTAFKQTAEFIAKYFNKGKLIAIEGCLRSGSYDDNGKKRARHNVVVDQVYFTGDRGGEQQSGNQFSSGFEEVDDDEASEDDLPF